MPPSASLRWLANRAWIASCSREHARFKAALGRPAEMQSRLLLELLRRNASTRFGRRHGFETIRSVAEFQERVPIADYDAFVNDIESIARGEAGVLTRDRVTRFQPTSGSAAATKLIPWTASLGREFQRGIAPWVAELYRRKPALLRGTSYWSISPPGTAPLTHGCLPVGFDHDARYLGFLGRMLFPLVSSTPPGLARCRDMEEFRRRTLVSLLADANLCLVSVWSPTFLTALLDDFLARPDEILRALGRTGLDRSNKRADQIRSLLGRGPHATFFQDVWPRLQVISCWTHGPSELYAGELGLRFPGVEIQGKGLVATEAFVTLPFLPERGPLLALTSHFFEFQEIEGGSILLAHELRDNQVCRVIVTTGGGLYRYSLHDLVRVTGFVQATPCLRFIGREGNVSDLFGEKLHGTFVQDAVRRVLVEHRVDARFFLLAPAASSGRETVYSLFLDAGRISDPAAIAASLERGLRENFHYAHCRNLGQLGPVRLFQIDRDASPPEMVFHEEMCRRGMRVGDAKAAPLDASCGWESRFKGRYIA